MTISIACRLPSLPNLTSQPHLYTSHSFTITTSISNFMSFVIPIAQSTLLPIAYPGDEENTAATRYNHN